MLTDHIGGKKSVKKTETEDILRKSTVVTADGPTETEDDDYEDDFEDEFEAYETSNEEEKNNSKSKN